MNLDNYQICEPRKKGGRGNRKGNSVAERPTGDKKVRKAGARAAACAPIPMKDTINGSCLTVQDVADIAASENLPASTTLNDLRRYFGSKNERIWLNKIRDPKVIDHLTRNRFRPTVPKEWHINPRTWLSNIDIENVLNQYESNLQSSFRAFRFLGCFPRDFGTVIHSGQCISPRLCNLNVEQLSLKQTRAMVIIFNLDTHDGPGTHWTSCFIGLDPNRSHRYGAFYYDSVGQSMYPGMRKFLRRIQREAGAMQKRNGLQGITFHIYENDIQKQRKNTECGIYALTFAILMITTDFPFEDICHSIMKEDDFMTKLRWIMFDRSS